MLRRRWLKQIGSGLALLLAMLLPYGLSRLLAPSPAKPPPGSPRGRQYRRLRPPGALADDAEFVSACIGCGLCGEVCPPRCIQFSRREGGAATNTPYIIAEEKACILCGKCTEVCPTRALTPTEPEAVNMGIAQIDRTACYPWVDRGVCGACAIICPLGERAIRFEFANMYRPVVQSGCVGCGLCVEICPHPSVPIRIAPRGSETVMPPQPA